MAEGENINSYQHRYENENPLTFDYSNVGHLLVHVALPDA